jgi:cell wall-associated NlpC family hydrolase
MSRGTLRTALCAAGTTVLLATALAAPAGASTNGGTAAPDGSGPQPTPAQSGDPGASPAPAPGPGQAGAAPGTQSPTTLSRLVVPGSVARIIHGLAAAPAAAPPVVQNAIWTANAIIGRPYVFGGGHGAFAASGYDCSGTVSFALHGGSLLSAPMDSSELESWGLNGRGRWISVYANGGHAYMNIAGIRLDTSAADDHSGLKGPRWRPMRHSNSGYRVRHPLGL